MTTPAISPAERLRALWASGDYAAIAREVIPALGPRLVAAAGVRPGDRVLDVAAGTGNAALPAALAGGGSPSTGRRRTPRRCPSPTARSTSCCRASA